MFLLFSLSGFVVSAALFYMLCRRIELIEKEIEVFTCKSSDPNLGVAFRKYFNSAILAELAPTATCQGLSSIPVRYRDQQDGFRSIGDLIYEIGSKSDSNTFMDSIELIKMFYKLEYSLPAQAELCDEMIGLLQHRLMNNSRSRVIGSIERIDRGRRCDTQVMNPVRSGSHVEQPLGFAIYTSENKIMHKAEVICR